MTATCTGKQVLFLASVGSDRCEELTAILRSHVLQLHVHHWDIDVRTGKKFASSNGFERAKASRSSINIIPVYDHYNAKCRGCDQFHKGFYYKLFGHKSGGVGVEVGESLCIHKFL